MMQQVRIHPVVNLEKKILTSIKNQNIEKYLGKYKIQILWDQNPKEFIPPFRDILNSLNYSIVKLPGKPWELHYKYKNIKGVTKILLHNEYNPTRNSLIFHHGLGMLNSLHLRMFLNQTLYDKFNIFSVKASHHESAKDLRDNLMNSFLNLTLCICASVLAVNEIVDFNKNNSNRKIIVTGVSLGGIVTSLHYFFFNTADLYFPVIAYPNFGEIILDKKNKNIVANFNKLTKNRSITSSFLIQDYLKQKNKKKIFPSIAKYDDLINITKAKKFWKGYNLKIFDVGHYSMFSKIEEIRKLILSNTPAE